MIAVIVTFHYGSEQASLAASASSHCLGIRSPDDPEIHENHELRGGIAVVACAAPMRSCPGICE
jgi:hypothetical protein